MSAPRHLPHWDEGQEPKLPAIPDPDALLAQTSHLVYSQQATDQAGVDQMYRTVEAYLKDPRFEVLVVVRPASAPAPIVTFTKTGPLTPPGQRGAMLFLQQAALVFGQMFAKYFDEGK